MRHLRNFSPLAIVASPIFWLSLGGAFLIVIGLNSCAHAPQRDVCIWLSPLNEFRCHAKDGTPYTLKPGDAKNLSCYDPGEDAEYMKYCGEK